jgi:hypothetical protein
MALLTTQPRPPTLSPPPSPPTAKQRRWVLWGVAAVISLALAALGGWQLWEQGDTKAPAVVVTEDATQGASTQLVAPEAATLGGVAERDAVQQAAAAQSAQLAQLGPQDWAAPDTMGGMSERIRLQEQPAATQPAALPDCVSPPEQTAC